MTTNNVLNLSSAGVVTYNGSGTFIGSTFAQHSFLVGGSGNAITGLGPATNGQVLIGATGNAPVLSTLTAGSGVSISNGSGSITISSTGGSTLPYTVVTTNTSLSTNNGYIANSSSGVITLTLPSTAAVGNLIEIVGLGSSGWSIGQPSGVQINFGNTNTTLGTGGSLSSTNRGDCTSLVCVVANTTWVAYSAVGNLTVV